MALTITVVAGAALLLGIESSMQSTEEALEQTIAGGMALQLIDEVMGNRYVELGVSPYQTVLMPSADEAAPGTRELYDDCDDFNGWESQPAVDCYGVELGADDGTGGTRNPHFQAPGGFFDNWRQEVDVYYVSGSNLTTPLPAGTPSDYRVVEVRIYKDDPARGLHKLVTLRRVIPYVPAL